MTNQSTQRSTRQKKLVLDYLQEHTSTHLSAEDIVAGLSRQATPVGKATVYRHLKQLTVDGLVRKYSLAKDAPACYEYVASGSSCHTHYHLLCEVCGNVTHFDCPDIARSCARAEKDQHFTIDEQKLVFYGRCSSCR